MEPLFWRANVIVTQNPFIEEKELNINLSSLNPKKVVKKTWLRNYFQDDTIYTFNLRSEGNKIGWEFSIKDHNLKETYKRGRRLLYILQRVFPGLDGQLDILPVYSFMLERQKLVKELQLPKVSDHDKISVIKNFIIASRLNSVNERRLNLYIIWQRDDSLDYRDPSNRLKEQTIYSDLKIKLYLMLDLNPLSQNINDNQKLMLDAELEFIAESIYNYSREKASLIEFKPQFNAWKHILESSVFWENKQKENTGYHYAYIKDKIPKETLPQFISSRYFDFTFPLNSGLPHPFLLENENVIDLPISEIDQNYVRFGKIKRQGVLSESNGYIEINQFALSCVIAGATGTGKTECASTIVNEITKKAPQVGILSIGLSKKNQEHHFDPDIILRYGDRELKIPYFITPVTTPSTLEKFAQETALYLTAAIGLKNTATTILYNVMMPLDKSQDLPTHPKTLFEKALDFLDDPHHQYHEKFQTNITSEIRNKVLERLSDALIENTLALTHDPPKWFQEWRKGKNVFIDLTECNIWTKRILCNALFQMIKTLTSDLEANQLNNLIVIDEAQQLFALPLSNNPYDDDKIAKERLEVVFKELLEEFRSRGLGFIIITPEPSQLFKCVSKSPSLRIVFRLDLECGQRFTLDQKELNYLKNQERFHALFFNGATGEEYIIKTLSKDQKS